MKMDLAAKKVNDTGKACTRNKILDASELEFSKHGYDSCSLRNISESHDINLGLIHYYFGSKEALFTEVFHRRSTQLATRRRELLSTALSRSANRPLAVAEIVRCHVTPTMDMLREGEGPKAHIRLVGLLRADNSDLARKLRDEAFSAINLAFIRELQRSCPHLSHASVVWRFSAMVGAFYALISQSSRVSELSGGLADPDDVDAMSAELIRFVTGGFAAPPADRPADETARPPEQFG